MFDVRSITVDCADPYRQALFWSKVTGWQEDPGDPNSPGDPEGRIISPQGFSLLFIPVPEGKTVKNRVHLDVRPGPGNADAVVARLTARGATVLHHGQQGPATWVTLADPEGNEFDLIKG